MKATIRSVWAAAVITGISCAVAAHAHGPNSPPKFGGIVTQHLDVQYEVVAAPDHFSIYIEDHKKPVATAQASAKVVLRSGIASKAATLLPGTFNELQARGDFSTAPGAVAEVEVAIPGRPLAVFRLPLAP